MSREMRRPGLYVRIIERIFFAHYGPRVTEFFFQREEIEEAARELGLRPPRNQGDLIYSFRFRRELPQPIRETAPPGMPWVIRLSGISRYRFQATALANILPTPGRAETKIPDATPGIITKHALSDEQALLAKVRYNRLVDIFSSVTCYSLQNHLRTQVPQIGQTETDEIYVGVDRRGAQYVFPVQAKGGRDKLSIVQIEQDYAMCAARFPSLICRPIAAQFMAADVIALFDFEMSGSDLVVASERHYRLVPPEEISALTSNGIVRGRKRISCSGSHRPRPGSAPAGPIAPSGRSGRRRAAPSRLILIASDFCLLRLDSSRSRPCATLLADIYD